MTESAATYHVVFRIVERDHNQPPAVSPLHSDVPEHLKEALEESINGVLARKSLLVNERAFTETIQPEGEETPYLIYFCYLENRSDAKASYLVCFLISASEEDQESLIL